MINDTIVALSTAFVTSAIGVIRMSGSKSFSILKKIIDKDIPSFKNRTTLVCNIIEADTIVDQVVCVLYKNPHSFTGEDTVEINCHGGLININRIIALCIANGARQADHGEFSKKAFYNGKIDLIQAESINDFIMSKSEEASSISMLGMKGKISNKIKDIKQKIVEILAQIQVNIDYPEYEDIEQLTNEVIKPRLIDIRNHIQKILKEAEIGRVIKDGIKVALIGRPNAGKSSILNALIDQDKAIVTDIPGTTRDVVEGKFVYSGITFNLLDTAGIRESNDYIEKIGIEKSRNAIQEADVCVLCLDGSLSNEEIEKDIKEFSIKNKKIITVINKNDLYKGDNASIKISAINNDVKNLKEALVNFAGVDITKINDFAMLSNARQIGLLKKSLSSLDNSISTIDNGYSIDIVSIDIQCSLDSLNDILGEKSKEDLDNEIFSKFCIGK